MDAADLIRRLHEHRAWVNQNLLDAARLLSTRALEEPYAIGQGSIWKTLVHLYAAEFVWLEALRGNPRGLVAGDVFDKLPGNQQGPGGITSLPDLESKWSQLAAHWQDYLDNLRGGDLDDEVARVGSDGKRRVTRRADVLLHVCTHAQYTAAQAVNMLRQAHAPRLPETMLISLARHQMGNP